tara:strand:- start:1992 stop:2180 length:189 start_codon:yes stop_codon:yes gene_type:complete
MENIKNSFKKLLERVEKDMKKEDKKIIEEKKDVVEKKTPVKEWYNNKLYDMLIKQWTKKKNG